MPGKHGFLSAFFKALTFGPEIPPSYNGHDPQAIMKVKDIETKFPAY